MILFPAIDLYQGQAVRLYKGDYDRMTVYSTDPGGIGEQFRDLGATHIHIVDLEGARAGSTPHLDTVLDIKRRSGLFCEIGGGIRSMEVVDRYLGAGVDRVILGTAAIEDERFLLEAVARYGDRIAVGADLRDGYVAVRGWREQSAVTADAFFCRMQESGVRTVICTDISRDGAMQGTNLQLYRRLCETYTMQITASGGVSSLEDVRRLREMELYGAIIGKAYYTGDIDLKEAVKLSR